MKKIELVSEFYEFENREELGKEDSKLIGEATLAVKEAYAPYSKFKVGAAVLLENGIIVRGNNQENASYPIGLCAERVALFAAAANHPGSAIVSIAVTAQSSRFRINQPIPPCGACRQAIAEYEQRYKHPIRIVLTGETGKVLVADGVRHLLPVQFDAGNLISEDNE